MKFAFKLFWTAPSGSVELLLATPFLDLPSLEKAREIAHQLVTHKGIPTHSLVIESEDGTISERLFWLAGQWRSKHA